jgi:biotin synthesis protein BioG
MKSCWLQRKRSNDCLLFMSGWGMGPEPFSEVDFGLTDVLMVFDYRSMDSSELFKLLPAGNLHLLAWSMGVWAASWLSQHDPHFAALRFSSSTAIGGTLSPIDNRCGIPVQDFEEMLGSFSPAKQESFYRSMFDCDEEAERFLLCKPCRSVELLWDELENLYKLCRSSGSARLPDIYNRRIVTTRDRIFPARNQVRAWGKENCVSGALPHFPFYSQERRIIIPTQEV